MGVILVWEDELEANTPHVKGTIDWDSTEPRPREVATAQFIVTSELTMRSVTIFLTLHILLVLTIVAHAESKDNKPKGLKVAKEDQMADEAWELMVDGMGIMVDWHDG